MKILIFIPLYKRPEVTGICFRNLKRFIKAVSWDIEVVCLMSPEDEHLKDNEKQVKKHGFKAIYFKNYPVSNKMNAGIRWIMANKTFDYLMNFGSDDLIHPEIEELYAPFFAKKHRFFGINSLYFYELNTEKTLYFHTYNFNGSIGAGRMIHYDILKEFYDQEYPVYEPGLDCGLDTSSAISIKRLLKEVDIGIESGQFPYIVDIKTATNINHLMHIETRGQHITAVDKSVITKYFDI